MRPAPPAIAVALALFIAAPTAQGQEAEGEAPVDLTGPPPAPEPEPEPEPSSWLDAPSERRCGFTFGLMGGAMLGAANGWPADALQVGRDEFRNSTGFAGGGQGVGYLGIALKDWFVLSVGAGGGGLRSADTVTRFVAFGFRMDAFPAYGLGGVWQDLGLMLDAGLGVSTTTDDETDVDVIESGVASDFRFGVFYEGIRAWKISMGPFAAVDAMFSPSMTRATGFVGWRTVLYAGP